MDAKDCRDCEKSTWVSRHARKPIGTMFNHQILPVSGPKIWKCFPPKIWCSATAKHKWYCCQRTSCCLQLFVASVGDITTILGLIFSSACTNDCRHFNVHSALLHRLHASEHFNRPLHPETVTVHLCVCIVVVVPVHGFVISSLLRSIQPS